MPTKPEGQPREIRVAIETLAAQIKTLSLEEGSSLVKGNRAIKEIAQYPGNLEQLKILLDNASGSKWVLSALQATVDIMVSQEQLEEEKRQQAQEIMDHGIHDE